MAVSQLFNNPAFKDFEKLFVGFEGQLGRMLKTHADLIKQVASYPPVNVRKLDDNHYTIEMAVAGFGQSDIDVELEGDKLVIRGNVHSDETSEDDTFLFKGIANRAFTRAFVLSDQIEVRNAELVNGMLRIALERIAPLTQARKVPVSTRS